MIDNQESTVKVKVKEKENLNNKKEKVIDNQLLLLSVASYIFFFL
jgi:hypothetical protein